MYMSEFLSVLANYFQI